MPEAMIISIGGTLAPIVKAISEYRPKFISFYASQQSWKDAAKIEEKLKEKEISFKNEITITESVDDLFQCYIKATEAIKRILSKGFNKDEVIVDYTGGTKSMSVGLSLAAITHGFSFSYVGGEERTKEGLGIVINGQEKICKSVNPWDFLAIEERKRFALLFNTYQFKASKSIIDNLTEKSTKYKSFFRKLGFIVDGFYLWDMFKHREALDRFKRSKAEELLDYADINIKLFVSSFNESIGFLKILLEKSRNGKAPCEELILDLFANAERRFEEGKIDDAVLRLYRLVELVAQERLLSSYGIDSSNVEMGKIPLSIRAEFINKYKNQQSGMIRISQTGSFRLLEVLNDEIGLIFKKNENKFLDIQSSRNYSYLAHGYKSSKDSTYTEFKEFILGLHLINTDSIILFPKLDF